MVEVSAPMRQWLGSAVAFAVMLFLGVAAVWAIGLPHWLLLPVAAAAVAGFVVTRPRGDESEADRSAFVRGDASGSTFDEVVSDGSDSFIDGNAIGAIFRRVIHRAPRRPRRRKDR